jgi:hypothetical protein
MFVRIMAVLNIAWIVITTAVNTESGRRAPVKIPELSQLCVRALEHIMN